MIQFREHGKQIRDAGFADVQSFAKYVMENVNAIYQEKDGRTFSMVVRGEQPNKNTIIKLEFAENDYYRVKTAYPVRSDNFDKKHRYGKERSPIISKRKPLARSRAIAVLRKI